MVSNAFQRPFDRSKTKCSFKAITKSYRIIPSELLPPFELLISKLDMNASRTNTSRQMNRISCFLVPMMIVRV